MALWTPAYVLFLSFLCAFVEYGLAQVLTPPTFNLAGGKKIKATSTCGVGVGIERELFCRLTGATGDEDSRETTKEIIQGQLCDYCDTRIPEQSHPIEYAIDGTERFWQSPPLSRGFEFNQVNITIDLEQKHDVYMDCEDYRTVIYNIGSKMEVEFHIAYIYIKMANSPRPGVWALEKSKDNGNTWEPWQYFADHTYECEKYFQTKADQPLETDDQVVCATAYSKIVPLENGEIVVSLINGRPSALNFTYADTLRSWLKATNIRIRLLRTKTLLGHLMAVARQYPSVSRRYFYSIKDISIGGRCVCNGHANSCDHLDPAQPDKLICECQHNTVGDQCEFCDAANGYVQKKWQPARAAKPFVCEPCQCFGRATGCVYNEEIDKLRYSLDIHGNYEGGGVCQNCLYNSEGINCEKCIAGFYRPNGVPLNDTHMCKPCVCNLHFSTGECEDGSGRCLCRPEYTGQNCDSCRVGYYGYPNCIPCECNINGTENAICAVGSGYCPCKLNYVGQKCDMCQFGFYGFPECRSCACNLNASSSNNCDVETGHCPCEINYGGRDCTQCAHGYYNYSACNLCSCDPTRTELEICSKEIGACLCLSNFNGPRCASCARDYFGYPNCFECGCKEPGSINNFCVQTGQCQCKVNYAGLNCERCAPGYYRYPDCVPCNCDLYGSYGVTCDQETGLCNCRPNFEGLMCQKCLKGFYNYPICEECNCNPAGAKEVSGFPLGGCGNVIPGLLCECKERVMGRFCDICKPGYWNLNRNNLLGCDECTCSEAGTIARMNLCNMVTGQCMCKVDVNGKNCDRCRDGYYNLQNTNLYGCVWCDCDIGGSRHGVCNKETGQCVCKARVGGRRCDQPISRHFIPSLTQLKFEIEDGRTPEGSKIRYGYDERIFPNYSWRGYAILIPYQPEVHLDIEITKPSLYRVVYHFVNRNDRPVRGEVTFTPDSFGDIQQKSEISFPPTDQPAFRTVGDSSGQHTFVLNPGRWTVSLKADNSIFLDYMVLIPQSYYEATILQQQVSRPCVAPNDQGPCVHYNYSNIGTDYPIVFGENGYIIDGDKRHPVSVFGNQNILDDLGITSMAVLDTSQRVLHLDMNVPKPGHYVMVLNYYSEGNGTQHLLFDIGDQQATAILYNCQYSSLCRQILTGFDEMVSQFNFTGGSVHIKITGDENINAAIESIVAIPYTDWSIGYVRPSIVCIKINGKCINGRYSTPVGSVRIEFEAPPNENLKTETRPPGILDHDAGLVRLNNTLSVIEISGSSRSQTQHRILVHYYMPTGTGPSIRVSIFANGEEYKGLFQPQYCPNAFGCRGLIYFDDRGTDIISLRDKPVRLVFNNTSGQDIWLDYMMLIPANQYNIQDLNFQPIDNSATFIGECVNEGFQIVDPVTEFCRDNIFTLTTDFNNGALDCYCDIDGSLSFTCDNFGGQCECRPNIIGRSCSACRPGYYGFPRCKPCNCPFGLCEPLTGKCICPPRVTGERCDTCIAETYGYDQLIGCEECSCNGQGVQDSNMNCDQATGQCSCLPNIKGRRCDHCVAGFHTFPLCQECECDHDGTIEDICDSVTAQCLCKKNVIGPRCDTCMPETFNLDPRNPAGCTVCFCMGTTAHCSSSNLNCETHMDMVDWGITNTVDGEVREAGSTMAVLDTLNKISDTSISMYWTAPDSYLGNKVRSYGGQLRYKVIYVLPRNDSINTESLNGPDLILFGKNMPIVYHSAAQPPPSGYFNMAVNLFEYKFYHADSNLEVTREQFMTVLVNLQALHIRASYYSFVQEIRLSEVELDVAIENGTGERALSVEQCACPSSYQGTSCESCARSHYRARNYPYLGTCVPCNCNRHADTCNTDTGKCYNCRDNTMGDNCELCKPGYFRDPRAGGCQICGCPLPVESNNDVTQQGFDGCIQDVTLKNRWDLNNNKQAKGVSPGCPEQIARVATFIGDKSYVAKPQDSVGVNFDVTFKMKTKQKQNLLMFIQKSDTGTGFSVSQVDGRIVAKLNNSEEMLTLTSRLNTYNDGGWHYISIMKMGRKLMLNIDDLEDMSKVAESLKDNLETDSALYFGGSDVPIAANLAATMEQFVGCVGDVTVNGRFLNFATLQKDKLASVSLAGCPIPDPTDQSATVLPSSEPERAVTEIPKTTLAPGTCALPTDPALEGDKDQTTGWLFGLTPNSSIEFDSLPGTIRIMSRFMLEFKTTELNGVFLYVADDKHKDFISLSLINGKVRYAFNPGTGAGIVTSPKTYNDGQWHTVEFARNQKKGPLVVDGKDIGVGISKGQARSLNVRPPYYFGGVPSDLPKKGKENLDDNTDNFIGCVRNFKVDDQIAGNPPRQTSVQTCYANLEYGSFFYGNDGYIKLVDSSNIGQDLDISIEVRPRSNSGVMFSVHSNKSDFLVLELANGDVVFTVDNGAGPFSTNFTLSMDNKICDGAWHKIRAIKNKNVLQLIVDDGEPQIASSASTATAADTNDPIYIGGVPEGQTKGIESTPSFLGCIRGLYLNSKRQYLATGVPFGSVQKESCPVD